MSDLYEKHRKDACEWCAKGLFLTSEGKHWNKSEGRMIQCPALPYPVWAEQTIAELQLEVEVANDAAAFFRDKAALHVAATGELQRQNAELLAGIEIAPHGVNCSHEVNPRCLYCADQKEAHGNRWIELDNYCRLHDGRDAGTKWTPRDPRPCNCWKSAIIAKYQAALEEKC